MWTLVTIAASGELLSASHTGGFVVWFFRTFFPHVDSRWWDITHTLLRKGAHFFNYAVLSWLWFRAARYWELRAVATSWTLRWSLWGLALAVATALADESLQHFVPSRTGSWEDVALDASGAAFAQLVIAWRLLARRRRAAA